MWLHESESNSLITEAYENKIFLTIIYISNNSPLILVVSTMIAIFLKARFLKDSAAPAAIAIASVGFV